ncbi:MAG: NYN domain-containing protein [Burkholderiales bacterium]|nr:MAG: NYN domain-containing protein [Burkholderiales bacterium]
MPAPGKPALLGPAASAAKEESQQLLAVLIDADNAQASTIEGLLAEIAKFGIASVKRIYGDWTQPQLGSWKKILLEHSIVPVQQFGYTKGKNATDSALIIDAMDLLYTGRFDGFCLVSSDSDFTRLASRLREQGLTVYGFGERKTPEPFVAACDKFVYTEVLRRTPEKPAAAGEQPRAAKVGDDRQVLVGLISDAIDAVSDDSGWAQLGAVGSNITKLRPDFDSRLYGHRKFSDLVKSLPEHFEVDEQTAAGSGGKSIYVRILRRTGR